MDVQKTMEFILEQQAQFGVKLDRVEGQVQALAEQVRLLMDEHAGLLRIVERQQMQISALTASHQSLVDSQIRTQEDLRTLTQRVDTMARMFEEWLRRSGNGSRPS